MSHEKLVEQIVDSSCFKHSVIRLVWWFVLVGIRELHVVTIRQSIFYENSHTVITNRRGLFT